MGLFEDTLTVFGYGGEGGKPEPAKPKPADAPKDVPAAPKKD
jgi:hypothetical protein